MNIIIVGATQVGVTLAENLVLENNDVTLIDTNQSRLRKLESRLDIKTVHGLGSHPDILKDALAEDADMLIAVSESDEVNMMACQIAYSLFNTPKKIARIKSSSYLVHKSIFKDDLIPVDFSINPERLITEYITKLVAQPGALQVWDFYNKKIQLVAVRLDAQTNLIHQSINELKNRIADLNCHIAAIFREGKILSMDDDSVFVEGDEVFVVAATKNISIMMKKINITGKANKRIMIAGGGNIGRLVASALEKKYEVKIIEADLDCSKRIASELHNTIVLYGDATDSELLIGENIDETDVFVSLTNDDEDNIMTCLQAKKLGAKKVMALVSRTIYAELIEGRGVDVVISPQSAAINSILSHIRQGDIANVYSIRNGDSEAIEIVIHGDESTSNIVKRKFTEVKLPEKCRIGAVIRKGELLNISQDDVFKEGDHAIVFLGDKKQLKNLEMLFQVKVTYI